MNVNSVPIIILSEIGMCISNKGKISICAVRFIEYPMSMFAIDSSNDIFLVCIV